jgi:hypothetical protein
LRHRRLQDAQRRQGDPDAEFPASARVEILGGVIAVGGGVLAYIRVDMLLNERRELRAAKPRRR